MNKKNIFVLAMMVAYLVFTESCQATYTWITLDDAAAASYGHQYAVTNNYYAGADWWDAEAEAVAVGAHLVSINDAVENSWLSTTFAGYYDERAPGKTWASLLWIGLYREDTTSEWKWTSGEPVDYMASWYSGSPLPDGLYAYLHPDSHPISGTWWNNPDQVVVGIMEIPEPATLLLLSLGAVMLIRKHRA